VYTESGGQGDPTLDTAQASAVMLEKHGIACDLMHGFNWGKWTSGTPTECLQLIPAGQEHVLEQDDGKKRWVQVVTELSRAFALCAASDAATAIRDDVSFFPGPASRFEQTAQQQPENTRADRCRHPPAREQGHHHRGPGHRRLHRRRFAQAGHQHPERPVPRRSARPQAQERRRRVAGETAERRTQGPLPARPGPGADRRRSGLLRRLGGQ
jgi:hypothetical protein